MAIEDPNLPAGPMTSAVGWKNSGVTAAATAR
jgi:hypothetical protein